MHALQTAGGWLTVVPSLVGDALKIVSPISFFPAKYTQIKRVLFNT